VGRHCTRLPRPLRVLLQPHHNADLLEGVGHKQLALQEAPHVSLRALHRVRKALFRSNLL
jgi:hypothetical protein